MRADWVGSARMKVDVSGRLPSEGSCAFDRAHSGAPVEVWLRSGAFDGSADGGERGARSAVTRQPRGAIGAQLSEQPLGSLGQCRRRTSCAAHGRKLAASKRKRMNQADIPARVLKREGIGARVPRKEDARHMVGKGNFVATSYCRVCRRSRAPAPAALLWRTPPSRVSIPEAIAGKVFLREMMLDAADIGSPSSLPTRHRPRRRWLQARSGTCGEAVAMAVAPTRAVAEDLLEEVQVSYAELPVYHGAESSLAATGDFLLF